MFRFVIGIVMLGVLSNCIVPSRGIVASNYIPDRYSDYRIQGETFIPYARRQYSNPNASSFYGVYPNYESNNSNLPLSQYRGNTSFPVSR